MPAELSPRDGYAAWAPLYDHDGNPLTALDAPAISRRLGDLKGTKALDLGCGTGRLSEILVQAGASVTGLDLTPEMVELAKRKFQSDQDIRWIIQNLDDELPFETNTFDIVVMGLVAEHITDIEAVLAEIARVLKSGGRLFLSNLHPDRTAEGQRARFIIPGTDERQPIQGYHRTLEQLRSAGSRHLELVEEEVLTVTDELSVTHPRAGRYVGLALGWLGVWVKRSSVNTVILFNKK